MEVVGKVYSIILGVLIISIIAGIVYYKRKIKR